MQTSVAVDVPGVDISPGDHICAFYPTLAERDDILLPFLRAGMRSGDKCIAVLDTDDVDEIDAALQVEGPVMADETVRQLDVQHSRDTYLRGGGFASDSMLDFWETSVGGAMDAGYSFVRSVGEMTWALTKMPGVDDLVSYEARLNRFLPRYPQVVLCLYELERFDGQVLVDVLKTHPMVLIGGMVLDNPYYLEPEEFLASR